MGEPSTAPGRVEGGGQLVLSFEQCFNLFCSFSLLFAFVVGGLGFEFCVFVAGWRHALRSEWPFIIIITIIINKVSEKRKTATRIGKQSPSDGTPVVPRLPSTCRLLACLVPVHLGVCNPCVCSRSGAVFHPRCHGPHALVSRTLLSC